MSCLSRLDSPCHFLEKGVIKFTKRYEITLFLFTQYFVCRNLTPDSELKSRMRAIRVSDYRRFVESLCVLLCGLRRVQLELKRVYESCGAKDRRDAVILAFNQIASRWNPFSLGFEKEKDVLATLATLKRLRDIHDFDFRANSEAQEKATKLVEEVETEGRKMFRELTFRSLIIEYTDCILFIRMYLGRLFDAYAFKEIFLEAKRIACEAKKPLLKVLVISAAPISESAKKYLEENKNKDIFRGVNLLQEEQDSLLVVARDDMPGLPVRLSIHRKEIYQFVTRCRHSSVGNRHVIVMPEDLFR